MILLLRYWKSHLRELHVIFAEDEDREKVYPD